MEQLDKLAEQKIQEIQQELYEAVKSPESSPRGKKLSKHILQNWFANQASKFKTLDGVKAALAAVYKQNGVMANSKVISSIISRYAKKVAVANERDPKKVSESFELDEAKLTQYQQKKKEEIVRAMKKHMDRFKGKYGSDAEKVLHATATQLARRDTSMAPLDD